MRDAVSASCNDMGAVGTENSKRRRILVNQISCENPVNAPEPSRTVVRCCEECVIGRAKRDVLYQSMVSAQRSEQRSVVHVPNTHSTVKGCSGQELVIATE